jgi:hypothetical protein
MEELSASFLKLKCKIQYDKAGILTWWQRALQSMYIQKAELEDLQSKEPELATEIKEWKD